MNNTKAHRRSRPNDRRAAAVMELAIILPVLFTLVFGTLEICQRLMLKQTATVAAYETARSAARRTITTVQARDRGLSILQNRNIVGGTISFVPAQIELLTAGQNFEVHVQIPINGNSPVNYVLPVSGQIQVAAYMLRE
jgi:Flp pilus assembly protein TadG